MRTIKITDLITKSFEHTKHVLFMPFVLKKWLRLLFIAVLAGAISGGGLGGNSGRDSEDKAEASLEANYIGNQEADSADAGTDEASTKTKRSSERLKATVAKLKLYLAEIPPGILWTVVSLTVLVVTGLILLLMWLSARFKFVWIHDIIHNDAAIAAPFRDYRKQGDSIFKLSIVVGLLFLVLLGIMGVWVYGTVVALGSVKNGIANMATAGISFTLVIVAFLAVGIVVLVWNIFVEHFVTPIMMLERSTYLPSWNKFYAVYKSNKWEFWLYLLVLLGMGIVCSIIEGIVCVIFGIAGVLTAGIIGGIGYLVFAILLKAKIVFVGFAIGAGIPLLIVFVLGIFSVFLPFAVFFRSFSLYFLSSLNAGYVPLALGEGEVKA